MKGLGHKAKLVNQGFLAFKADDTESKEDAEYDNGRNGVFCECSK